MKNSKVCKGCSIEKSIDEYYIQREGKTGPIYFSRCKSCNLIQNKKNYHKLSENQKKTRREKNPCNTFEWRQQYRLKTRFGLTMEDFSAMVIKQNNKCKICECEMDIPQIDHNHITGKVRHLLCKPCNTSLGLLKENINTLHNMISYIKNDNL